MRSAAEKPYLSIGEVLGLLLEEFPDVTISKIRFLESQGLIVPERTASGYRKFYDEDVELLRYILREQKEHFLPLRVIKDRLETPPEGLDRPPPRGIKNLPAHGPGGSPSPRDATAAMDRSDVPKSGDSTQSLDRSRSHPSGQRILRAVDDTSFVERRSRDETTSETPSSVPGSGDRTRGMIRGDASSDTSDVYDRTASYSRREVVAMTQCDPELVRELERFGMIEGRTVGDEVVFDEQDVQVCEIAKDFDDAGIDIRHLRAWKTAADREAGLFEQRVLPILRRRTPEARLESDEVLDRLSDLGAKLRMILLSRSLSSLRDSR